MTAPSKSWITQTSVNSMALCRDKLTEEMAVLADVDSSYLFGLVQRLAFAMSEEDAIKEWRFMFGEDPPQEDPDDSEE